MSGQQQFFGTEGPMAAVKKVCGSESNVALAEQIHSLEMGWREVANGYDALYKKVCEDRAALILLLQRLFYESLKAKPEDFQLFAKQEIETVLNNFADGFPAAMAVSNGR